MTRMAQYRNQNDNVRPGWHVYKASGKRLPARPRHRCLLYHSAIDAFDGICLIEGVRGMVHRVHRAYLSPTLVVVTLICIALLSFALS